MRTRAGDYRKQNYVENELPISKTLKYTNNKKLNDIHIHYDSLVNRLKVHRLKSDVILI